MFKSILSYKFILLALSSLIFLYTFGSKVVRIDDFLLANAYDGLKNYFNFLYYTKVQSGVGLWDYTGMNFPYFENVLYTDNSPILAIAVKLFGLESLSLSAYNLFFLSNLLISPLIAYKLGNELGLSRGLNLIFSLFIVWMHPALLYTSEWTNLSLSIYFLLAAFFFVKHIKANVNSTSYFSKYLVFSFLLIVCASLTHLYYLPLLGTFLGFAYLFALIKIDFKTGVIGGLFVLLSGLAILLIIHGVDSDLSLRPTSVMGYDSGDSTCSWSDYFKSYNHLTWPAYYEQTDWNIKKLKFLGSGFPIILALGMFFFFRWYRERNQEKLSDNGKIVWGIFFGGMICFFTSMGSRIELFSSEISIYNFFNPLNIGAEIFGSLKQFRSMSRFGLPAFTGITIAAFYLLNIIWSRYKALNFVKFFMAVVFLTMIVDIGQTAMFFKKGFNSNSFFSQHALRDFPAFENLEIDAILPIPYYHVGAESHGLIIDDNNYWSKKTYQMAMKYKAPLMSSKMSRTPPEIAQKMLSLFSSEPHPELMSKLRGKSILICVDGNNELIIPDVEPAKSVAATAKNYPQIWNAQFLEEKNGISYYIQRF